VYFNKLTYIALKKRNVCSQWIKLLFAVLHTVGVQSNGDVERRPGQVSVKRFFSQQKQFPVTASLSA